MYCYCCGAYKADPLCSVCGAEENRRFVPRTDEGKALRGLFDMEGIGPASTLGDPGQFERLLTDVLPGNRFDFFRAQLGSIMGLYTVRQMLLGQLTARRLPDESLFAALCLSAQSTGYSDEACRRVITALYEMIGWTVPAVTPQQNPLPPAAPRLRPGPAPASPIPPAPQPVPSPALYPVPPSTFKKTLPGLGDTVRFGRFPQTAAGTDSTPIDWFVMDVDGNRALLVSQHGLDARPYHAGWALRPTWESSTIRAWLNSDFMVRAFTPQEQADILLTDVDNSLKQTFAYSPIENGRNTQDRVFLLSLSEVGDYLHFGWETLRRYNRHHADFDRACEIVSHLSPTAYAQAACEREDPHGRLKDSKAPFWWLRSPGHDYRYYAIVGADGKVYNELMRRASVLVRPALWIRRDSAFL